MNNLSYVCKKDTGIIYGNLIRQIALKGTDSWRPIAYSVGKKSNSVGLMGSLNFNTTQLFGAKLIQVAEVPKTPEVKIESFRKASNIFKNQYFELHNLGNLNIEHIDVCLHYTNGYYSVEDNTSYLQNNTNLILEDWICVSSRHADAIKVVFTVEPIDEFQEQLIFHCDAEPIIAAVQSIGQAVAVFLERR